MTAEMAPGHRREPRTRRLAYIMSRFPKLSETFVLFELLAVKERGVPVDIYPLLREREPVVHPEASPLVARAHYEPFVSLPIVRSQLWYLAHRPGRYLGALWTSLAGTFGSLNFFVGAVGIFPKVAHMARRMEATGVAHVHCHFANHPALAGLIVHRLTGIPYSFTAHGSDLHVDRRMLARKVAEAAFVATVSDFNRELIVAEAGPGSSDKVVVLRCGVDTSVFRPRPGDRSPGPFRIVCVGTLHEVKGQKHLVEAVRILAAEGTDVECHLVGDGPDRVPLERQVAMAGLDGRVGLEGSLTRSRIASLLAEADAVVAPSVPTASGKREGIPVALMEGMACGLPAVASRLSGIPELVEDGVNGFLVPPGDAPALAAALSLLAADNGLAGRLGRAARQRILDDYDLHTNSARLVDRFGLGEGS